VRLRPFEVGDLEPAQQSLYDSIAGGPRANGPFTLVDEAGRLTGPFNAMLLWPPLGSALQALGAAVRYQTTFSDRAREIAILVVAQVCDSAFERYAHEAVGRVAGLSGSELDALRAGRFDGFTDPYERLVADTAMALASRHDLTDAEYAAARDGGLGEAGIFELSTLVGYYATLALQLRAFRVTAPSQVSPGPGPGASGSGP
jgi:4-carboxymuconolactone decarboxylase